MFFTAVRLVGKKPKPKLKPINPKIPPEQALSVSRSIFNVVKEHGPLNIANAWDRVQEAGINGVNSKSHLKLMLRWMKERQKLHMICNHVGRNKQFLYSTWFTKPENTIGDASKQAAETKIKSAAGQQSVKSKISSSASQQAAKSNIRSPAIRQKAKIR
ncbi:hypothetical protein SUGI_0455200 [Cryptomeria japonica]|uniref:uncharacterized protein LOC131057417 n=1 Tax=Cryptomeria japonica TaxID=3369 RepID=UPI002408E70B|nr:uncharacterized protein LOC131057417 [Cryptomeria japonica]GLJ23946.1 hypothetical protein SUGI_0455200 [Cryptomeria japonica]